MDGDKQQNQEPGWVFNPGSSQVPAAPQLVQQPVHHNPEMTVEWTGSEFIAHHKKMGWYLGLVLFAVVVAGVIYLLTKDEISTVAVLVACMLFGVAGSRKPRVLAYRLDHSGLAIGQKVYPYGLFRSFTIVDEGPFSSVTLLPIKRFSPSYNIYFSPEDEEKIMDVLVSYLPFEQRKDSLFDSLVHRMRF